MEINVVLLFNRNSTQRIDQSRRIVGDVGVTVPGLGIGEVDGGEAVGVGGDPATELGGILAKLGVVEIGFGVALVAGEFVVIYSGLLIPFLAIRKESGGPDGIAIKARNQASRSKVVT